VIAGDPQRLATVGVRDLLIVQDGDATLSPTGVKRATSSRSSRN
jgi:hypothetical protein